jgi:hypothetical protein
MGQQDMADTDLPARRNRMAPWLRRIAAGALALTLGLGQAYADGTTSAHEGGQGADKSGSAFASAEAFAGDGAARASSAGRSDAFGAAAYEAAAADAKRKAEEAKVTVTVDIEEEGVGTSAWTRTVTRTSVSRRFVTSVTRSQSYATDEEGNLAIAKAMAKARAPNNVAAVRNVAGRITAKTSVDVTGNGVAGADAGGSIGIAGGGVKVSTWGRTSADVF